MKKLVLHVLMTMFLAAVALSQEGYSKGNPAAGPLSGPFPDRTTTRSFKSDDGSGSGRSGGGLLGNAAGVRGLLPSTGGAALAVLGVGVVLILGGLAVRRVFW